MVPHSPLLPPLFFWQTCNSPLQHITSIPQAPTCQLLMSPLGLFNLGISVGWDEGEPHEASPQPHEEAQRGWTGPERAYIGQGRAGWDRSAGVWVSAARVGCSRANLWAAMRGVIQEHWCTGSCSHWCHVSKLAKQRGCLRSHWLPPRLPCNPSYPWQLACDLQTPPLSLELLNAAFQQLRISCLSEGIKCSSQKNHLPFFQSSRLWVGENITIHVIDYVGCQSFPLDFNWEGNALIEHIKASIKCNCCVLMAWKPALDSLSRPTFEWLSQTFF